KLHFEKETQLNITFPKDREAAVLKALFGAHPYEEVAYEIASLDNKNQHIGIGMHGELPSPLSEKDFFEKLKSTFGLKVIRHSALLGKPIRKAAVLGGSGAFAIEAAKAVKADVYVSADFKYHDFFRAEKQLVLADI